MNKKELNTIIYYAVSSLHVENAKILFENTNYKIIILFEKELNIINSSYFSKSNFEFVHFKKNLVPTYIWKKNIICAIFSTTQLRKSPLNLIISAIKYNITSIAVEEVHQMLLHENRMNNYLLPVDYYMITSNYEKNSFIKLGYDKKKLHVTGWPFQSRTKFSSKNLLTTNRQKIKILVVFSASNLINPYSIYSEKIFINFVNILCKTIEHTVFDVKFHPSENYRILKKIYNKYRNNINILDQKQNISEIISNYSLIICDTTTNSIFEILNLNIPFLIYDHGNNQSLKRFIHKSIFFQDKNQLNDSLKFISNFKIDPYSELQKKINNINLNSSKNNVLYLIKKFSNSKKKSINSSQIIDLNLWNLLINFKTNNYLLKIDKNIYKHFINLENKIKNFDYYLFLLKLTKGRISQNIVIYYRINHLLKLNKKIENKDIIYLRNFPNNYFILRFLRCVLRLLFLMVLKNTYSDYNNFYTKIQSMLKNVKIPKKNLILNYFLKTFYFLTKVLKNDK